MTRDEVANELSRHHADCVGWALACCRHDRSEAEDVLQTAYLKVLDGRAAFGERSAFRTWLFGVIRRTAAEHRRRRMLRGFWPAPSASDAAMVPDASPDPAEALARSESARSLLAALDTLPGRQREVLHLVFYQELTIADAAAVLGVSLGSARTHYERGKARLRERLHREDMR